MTMLDPDYILGRTVAAQYMISEILALLRERGIETVGTH